MSSPFTSETPATDEVRLTLDLVSFKALASPTRIGILKALDERQKTVTELVPELNLSKAAVHEHLNVLVEAGLVQRLDQEERKWVYYKLTWKGTGIVNPAKRRVAFFLALSTTFFVPGFVYLLVLVADLAQRARAFESAAASRGALAVQGGGAAVVGTFTDLAGPALVLATSGVLLALAVVEWRRATTSRRLVPEETER